MRLGAKIYLQHLVHTNERCSKFVSSSVHQKHNTHTHRCNTKQIKEDKQLSRRTNKIKSSALAALGAIHNHFGCGCACLCSAFLVAEKLIKLTRQHLTFYQHSFRGCDKLLSCKQYLWHGNVNFYVQHSAQRNLSNSIRSVQSV